MAGRRNGNDFGGGGDFQERNSLMYADDGDEGSEDPRYQEYMQNLQREKIALDREKFPFAFKYLDQEITRAKLDRKGPKKSYKYVDVFHELPTVVSAKVLVPVKRFPKFNFVGKLLGPKGHTLKKLQEDTQCRMTILGRGSVRDKDKEDEMRNSNELKFAHLADELHVEVSALAPPAEAYARIAFALTEVQKYLVPDGSDDISKGQLQEMGIYEERPPRRRPGPPPGVGGGPGPIRRPPIGGGAGPSRPTAPSQDPRRAPGKPNVTSFLERSRAQFEESYDEDYDQSYNDDYDQSYNSNYQSSGPQKHSGYGGKRNVSDYDQFQSDSQQQWKPYNASGPQNRTEQPRFRSTPYARPGK